MASTRLVLVLCLMIGHTSGQQGKCQASVQGVSSKPGVCPSTWIQWEGNCYKATGQALNWTQAREECIQMGGTMVAPQYESETEFLLQLGYGQYTGMWINCNDIETEGTWVCEEEEGTESEPSRIQWDMAEPNGGVSENCVFLRVQGDGKWVDAPCSWDKSAVCKQPRPVATPKLHL